MEYMEEEYLEIMAGTKKGIELKAGLCEQEWKDINNSKIKDFITYYAPSCISDFSLISESYKSLRRDDSLFAAHILCIRRHVSFEEAKVLFKGNETAREEVYSEYKKAFIHDYPGRVLFSYLNDFKKFVGMVFFVVLGDISYLTEDEGIPSKKTLDYMTNQLSSCLNISKAHQYEYVYYILSHKEDLKKSVARKMYIPSSFSTLTSNEQREEFAGLVSGFLDKTSIDSACALCISKRNVESSVEKQRYLSIEVELKMLMPLFSTNIRHDVDNLVLFATPFTIRSWMGKRSNRTIPITFVVESEIESKLLNVDSKENKETFPLLSIVSYPEFKKTFHRESRKLNILIIDSMAEEEHRDIISVLRNYDDVKAVALVDDMSLSNTTCLSNQLVRCENLQLDSIEMLPMKMKIDPPKHKSILRLSSIKTNEDNHESFIIKDSIFTSSDGERCLYRGDKRPFNIEAFLTSGTNLSRYRHGIDDGKDRCRASRTIFNVTKEICVSYTQSPSGVRIYPCYPLVNGQYRQDSTSCKIISNMRNSSIEEIEDYITHDYPTSSIFTRKRKTSEVDKYDSSTNEKYVWRVLGNIYIPLLRDTSITWATFLLLYRDQTILQASKKEKVIIESLLKWGLGDMYVDTYVSSTYLDLIRCNISEEEDEIFYLLVLESLLEIAIDKGYAHDNVVSFLIAEQSEVISRKKSTRAELIRDRLDIHEYTILRKAVHDNLEREKTLVSLAGYIRVVTGLSANIICALKSCDFVYNILSNTYYLNIYNYCLSDSSDIKAIPTRKIRYYPLSDGLASYIKERINLLKDKDAYLFSSNCSCEIDSVLHPADLERYIKNEIKTVLNIEEESIYLPTEEGLVAISLTKSRADLIKNSIDYLLSKYANCSRDEVLFLQGNICASTLGRHYWDANNILSLDSLKTKLERLEAFFENPPEEHVPIIFKGPIEEPYAVASRYSQKVTILVNNPNSCDATVKVALNNALYDTCKE